MALVGDGKLAVAQRVPQLDRAVAGARDDLAVVGGEGDGEDVVGVADEAARRHARGELPQPERLVPGGGEGVGAVGRDDLFPKQPCQPAQKKIGFWITEREELR